MMERVHATCVAVNGRGVLLRGPAGSGKSDLALRLVMRPGDNTQLVSDDQVNLLARDGRLLAGAPDTIAGKLEVRGVGIVEFPAVSDTPLALVVDLVPADEVPRLPDDPLPEVELHGVTLPVLKLFPFENSAPLKLALALGSLP